jgi:hypothetical protein
MAERAVLNGSNVGRLHPDFPMDPNTDRFERRLRASLERVKKPLDELDGVVGYGQDLRGKMTEVRELVEEVRDGMRGARPEVAEECARQIRASEEVLARMGVRFSVHGQSGRSLSVASSQQDKKEQNRVYRRAREQEALIDEEERILEEQEAVDSAIFAAKARSRGARVRQDLDDRRFEVAAARSESLVRIEDEIANDMGSVHGLDADSVNSWMDGTYREGDNTTLFVTNSVSEPDMTNVTANVDPYAVPFGTTTLVADCPVTGSNARSRTASCCRHTVLDMSVLDIPLPLPPPSSLPSPPPPPPPPPHHITTPYYTIPHHIVPHHHHHHQTTPHQTIPHHHTIPHHITSHHHNTTPLYHYHYITTITSFHHHHYHHRAFVRRPGLRSEFWQTERMRI